MVDEIVGTTCHDGRKRSKLDQIKLPPNFGQDDSTGQSERLFVKADQIVVRLNKYVHLFSINDPFEGSKHDG